MYAFNLRVLPAVCLLLLSGPSASANLILLQDDFNDNSLDPAKWNAVTTGIPQGGADILEQNGRLELVQRGHLNTANPFDPNDPAVGGLRITGRWTFLNADDFMQVLTRSDGVPAGSFGETNNGLEFRASVPGNNLQIQGRGAAITGGAAMIMPGNISTGDVFDFEIIDDGFNLGFTFTRVSNPADTLTLSATSTHAPANNLISFHNRESSGRRSALDDLVIRSLTIPEPSTISLVLMGLLLVRMRRIRSWK